MKVTLLNLRGVIDSILTSTIAYIYHIPQAVVDDVSLDNRSPNFSTLSTLYSCLKVDCQKYSFLAYIRFCTFQDFSGYQSVRDKKPCAFKNASFERSGDTTGDLYIQGTDRNTMINKWFILYCSLEQTIKEDIIYPREKWYF